LAQSFSANGGVGYLRRLLKEILWAWTDLYQ
jgi:hypothetical protein